MASGRLEGLKALSIILALSVTSVASAKAHPAHLSTLPADELLTLVPSLHGSDIALIEYDRKGSLKQLTTVTLVAAPPAEVRDVVAHPERYGQFVHNMSRSTVRQERGGTLVHDYKLDYTIASVWGSHRYVFLPPAPGMGAAPIEMYDPEDNGTRHYRWEFLTAPGGTLLVLYGYTQIPTDSIYGKLIRRAQTLEYGLALIPQMTLLLAIKQQSEKLSKWPPPPTGGKQPDLDFLLARGTVAWMRRAGGRLAEVNFIDRTRARPEVLVNVAGNVGEWSHFVPTISKSSSRRPYQGLPTYEIEQSLPLMSWDTMWGVFAKGNAVDMFGLDGDLKRARMRWDVRPLHDGVNQAEVVLRTVETFDRSSMVIRELYKLEPLFEYGVNVGLQLVILRGVKQRAEALSPSTAAR